MWISKEKKIINRKCLSLLYFTMEIKTLCTFFVFISCLCFRFGWRRKLEEAIGILNVFQPTGLKSGYKTRCVRNTFLFLFYYYIYCDILYSYYVRKKKNWEDENLTVTCVTLVVNVERYLVFSKVKLRATKNTIFKFDKI